MGGACTTGVETLPDPKLVITGTEIPEWVSAGGQTLFQQAAELAKSPYPAFQAPRIASYDGSKLTPAEREAARILTEESGAYKPYIDEAASRAQQLGQGYNAMSAEQLMGPGYGGATRNQLVGGPASTYKGMTADQLIGQGVDLTGYTGPMGRQGDLTRGELVGDYQGATREQLTGPKFTLESAQPFLDIYQGAADPAVREVERQIAAQQTANRAQAARAGAFGGSRAAISDILTASEGAARAGDIRSQASQQGLGFAAKQFEADRAARFGAEQALSAQAERDRAARFAAESDLYGRFSQDRAFGAEMSMADRSARMAQAERDRAARFGAEQAGRSAYETRMAQRERDRAARFGAEDVLRQRYQQDREARFGAEAAQRGAFETQESARTGAVSQIASFAPAVQGLQQQAASGMISSGEAQRSLDQMALDLAYADFVEQREYPFQMVNYALGALKGIPYETTQTSLQQGQQFVQTPSIYGQTIGGLGALGSAYFMSRPR